MIAHKKEFAGGLLLFIGFWIVFAIGMTPIFNGQNILNYMDNLYNTISKKSAYYIPAVKGKIVAYQGQTTDFTIKAKNPEQAVRMARQLEAGQATVTINGNEIKVVGDLGLMLENLVNDADVMFANDGQAIVAKYGYNERLALYDAWNAMKSAEKDLNKQSRFKEAKIINQVQTRALEPAYNYYGIQAESITERLGIVIASLVGYVIYTLWFGFAILFMFEGWGLKLEH